MVNQAELTGALLFIGILVTLGFLVWRVFQDTEQSNVAETPEGDPRYESEEQKQPWDETIGNESHYQTTNTDDPSATYEGYEEASSWEYVTEFVDPDVPAKRADDPLPSDWYVVEQNGLDEYRSVPKLEWIENVHESTMGEMGE